MGNGYHFYPYTMKKQFSAVTLILTAAILLSSLWLGPTVAAEGGGRNLLPSRGSFWTAHENLNPITGDSENGFNFEPKVGFEWSKATFTQIYKYTIAAGDSLSYDFTFSNYGHVYIYLNGDSDSNPSIKNQIPNAHGAGDYNGDGVIGAGTFQGTLDLSAFAGRQVTKVEVLVNRYGTGNPAVVILKDLSLTGTAEAAEGIVPLSEIDIQASLMAASAGDWSNELGNNLNVTQNADGSFTFVPQGAWGQVLGYRDPVTVGENWYLAYDFTLQAAGGFRLLYLSDFNLNAVIADAHGADLDEDGNLPAGTYQGALNVKYWGITGRETPYTVAVAVGGRLDLRQLAFGTKKTGGGEVPPGETPGGSDPTTPAVPAQTLKIDQLKKAVDLMAPDIKSWSNELEKDLNVTQNADGSFTFTPVGTWGQILGYRQPATILDKWYLAYDFTITGTGGVRLIHLDGFNLDEIIASLHGVKLDADGNLPAGDYKGVVSVKDWGITGKETLYTVVRTTNQITMRTLFFGTVKPPLAKLPRYKMTANLLPKDMKSWGDGKETVNITGSNKSYTLKPKDGYGWCVGYISDAEMAEGNVIIYDFTVTGSASYDINNTNHFAKRIAAAHGVELVEDVRLPDGDYRGVLKVSDLYENGEAIDMLKATVADGSLTLRTFALGVVLGPNTSDKGADVLTGVVISMGAVLAAGFCMLAIQKRKSKNPE